MNEDIIREAIEHYRTQGAPQDQQMLIALLREIQQELGGTLSAQALERIAAAYEIKPALLLAIIRRAPSLRLDAVPNRLEVCGACRLGAKLRNFIEKTYGIKSGEESKSAGFSYRVVPCMKNCKNGPSIRFNGTLYSRADEKMIRELIEKAGKS